jgi:WD40 repeat protein
MGNWPGKGGRALVAATAHLAAALPLAMPVHAVPAGDDGQAAFETSAGGGSTYHRFQAEFNRGLAFLVEEPVDPDAAEPRFVAALEILPFQPECAYNLACIHALRGNLATGLEWLERAAEWGLSAVREVKYDRQLDPLRVDAQRFGAVLRIVEANDAIEAGQLSRSEARAPANPREVQAQRERSGRGLRVRWDEVHSRAITGLRLSPDGRRLVTWGYDGSIVLWSPVDRRPPHLVTTASRNGVSAEFNADGSRLLVLDRPAGLATLWYGDGGEPLRTLEEPAQVVTVAAFSPDGRSILTGDARGVVRLWDADGNERPGEFIGDGPIDFAAFSPDGRMIMAHTTNDRVSLWRTGGDPIRLLESTQHPPMEARFASGSDRVLARSSMNVLVSWPVAPDARPQVHFDPEGRWTEAIWSMDGRSFLAATPTGLTRVQTVPDSRGAAVPGAPIPVEIGSDLRLFLGPRGGRIATISDVRSTLWDATTGMEIGTLDNIGRPWSVDVRFSSDEKRMLAISNTSGSRSGPAWMAQVWEETAGQEWAPSYLYPDAGDFTAFDVNPAGDIMAVATSTGSIVVWRSKGGFTSFNSRDTDPDIREDIEVVRREPPFRGLTGALSPDGRTALSMTIALSDQEAGPTCRAWSLQTGEPVRNLGSFEGSVLHAAFTPDGRRLVLSGDDQGLQRRPRVELVDVATGEISATLRAFGQVAVSPDGRRVLARVGDGSSVALFDAATGAAIATLPRVHFFQAGEAGEPRVQAAFSADGSRIATAQLDGRIRLWDGATGELRGELPGHDNFILHIAFAPQGPLLVSSAAGITGDVRLWDTAALALVRTIRAHEGYVRFVSFDPAGRRLVTAGEDWLARLWSLDDAARPPLVLSGHSAVLHHAVFSPDGALVLTCAADSTARLWDAGTGECIAVLEGHRNGVAHGAFTPDSRRVLTSSFDGTIRVWDATLRARGGEVEPLLSRVDYPRGAWVAFEPSGHYVSGEDGDDLAWMSVEGEEVPLSSYAALLNKPDRVATVLAGDRVRAPALLAPPQIDILAPVERRVSDREFTLSVRAIDTRRTIDEIILTQDGATQRIPASQFTADPAGGSRLAVRLRIPDASTGGQTRVTVRARNSGGVLSAPRSQEYEYIAANPDLYVLAVGVGDYAREDLRLKCPTKDAADLVNAFRAQAGNGLYRKVEPLTLTNAQVTGGALARAVRDFLRHAEEKDTIVVFLAGHGARDSVGDYYFLTRDATPETPEDGIARGAVEDLVKSPHLRARRRILLLDTCFSGVAVDGARGAERQFRPGDFTDLVAADEEGICVIAASSADQRAFELEENGAFTRAFLEALGGAEGVDDDGDSQLRVREIKNYLDRRVPQLTKLPQTPTYAEVRGGDGFTIARVTPRAAAAGPP